MSEEEEGGLPPGKLKDLKKLFEDKNAQSSDAPVGGVLLAAKTPGGRGKPATPAKPIPGANAGQPKPAPRQGSPGKRGVTVSDSAVPFPCNRLSVGDETPFSYCTAPRPRRRTMSKDQDGTATLDRKSAAQKRLSPTVSRRVAMFADEDNSKGEMEDSENENKTVERRVLTPSARTGNPKRLSDPCTDLEEPPHRKNTAERRKTMDNFPVVESKSGEVKVLDRVRKFQEKPVPPKKPVVASAAHPAPAGDDDHLKTEVTHNEETEASYEVPWDLKPGKNVERLNKMSGNQQSHQKGKPSGPDGHGHVGKDKAGASKTATLPRAKGHASRQKPRPTEQPPPPPSKPPRTFVHEEYLASKAQDQPNDQNMQEVNSAPIKDKMSVSAIEGSSVDKVEVALRNAGKASHTPTPKDSREMKGVREKPPSRPPPPRPRPISEASTLLNRRNAASPRRTKDSSDSENEGPIVISAKTGRRIGRQVSMCSPHRKPNDRLPARPERDESLHRFPLRKSFSSECLYKGSVSSLSDIGTEEECSPRTLMQSYHAGNFIDDEPIYEAVIDSDGYAVPNRFIRLPQNNQVAKGAQVVPNRQGFLKRLLGPSSAPGAAPPGVPNTTPIKDQDVDKVPAKKMNLVKQKINQAYEALQVVFRRPSSCEDGDQDGMEHPDEQDSGDSDSIVDVTEINQRVTYCSTVRLKTLQSVKKAREFMDKIYPQLFEYTLIVGLSAKTDDPGYEPVVLHKFPQTRSYKVGDQGHLLFFADMVESNVSVPTFCFPDAEEFRPGFATAVSESYSFVLTHVDGNRMYGYCRRMQPRDASLPEVICIISPINAFNMYNKLLSEIETRRYKSLDHAQEMIASAFGRPMPKPGKVCHVRALDEKGDLETLMLERPSDEHLANVNYESLLLYLGTDKLIQVFSSMLMERRLILCSKQLGVLTQTIHALVALLYPFHWQHVYIPLLPPDMLEVCSCPTPFIIGILRSHLTKVTQLDLEDVIIVDLDSKQVLRSMGDEMNLLPKKVQKALKTAINMCKIDSDALHSQWLMVSEAFLRMFLETLGHFGQYLFTQQDGTKTLMRDQFIAGAPTKAIRQFLEWFTETQMFEVFISMHVEKQHWGSMDLFMSRLGELQKKRQAEGSAVKGIGQKVKNLGKALKTKWKDT